MASLTIDMKFLILAALLFYCCSENPVGTSELTTPSHSCPSYLLTEGENLTCECIATPTDHNCKAYWLGHPDKPQLQKVNVTREDNGTRFTCEMDCSGQKSSTDYILQVAYGPPEGSVKIDGPSLFLADGDQTMTLTCSHGEMNPAPNFNWKCNGGLQCDNGDTENTCVLKPRYFHDGNNVRCTVTNVITDTKVAADFTVNLTYPPPKKPLISGYTKGTPLKEGDNVTCAVKGGKPLVSTVYLNFSDQDFPCETLTTGDTRTTSCKMDFKVDNADIKEIECSCSAVWEEDPQLYVHVATDTIKVDTQSPSGGYRLSGQHGGGHAGAETGSGGVTIGVPLASVIIVIAVVVIVFIVIRRRNRRHKGGVYDVVFKQSLKSNKVDFSPLPPPIGEDDKSSDTTLHDSETDSAYSTRPGSRESIPLSSANSASERDVEEPAAMSGDYSTILDEPRVGVKTPVKVLALDNSSEYTEVQIDMPSAEPEPPVPTASPYDVVDISQLDLPRPEICLPTSQFASFRISQSTPKYRGPLGDQYTLVDKKKGHCLPMVHEDNNAERADTVEPNQKCNTEADKMKDQQAEDCHDGTYERLYHGPNTTPRVGANPEQVYNHIDRTVSGHHTHTDIGVC